MPHTVNLSGTRGDEFHVAIPLMVPESPPRPATLADVARLIATYPVIRMQVRQRATAATVLIELTSAAGELRFEPDAPLPTGGTGPALVISGPAHKMTPVLPHAAPGARALGPGPGVYDIEFSGPEHGPFTWVGGAFVLAQDVTDNGLDDGAP
ncbi:hypothetical protein [uncultured Deinococcus sp.]|uniref:hypothetical protein n=1 Tax=uncultured Deinococcus sp. TaxID=158789 RepID=UPI0025E2770B|nr:hypothetical protein [uncultured Deinococcus sp.]